MGIRGLHPLRGCRHGRNKSLAFDLPEGESELVAGYFTEYSGFKFALFFLGEYVGMLGISGLGRPCFWADIRRRCRSSIRSVVDLVLLEDHAVDVRLYLGSRTLPRLRQDQLMNFAWKFVLPLSLLNLIVAGSGASWRRMAALGGLLNNSVVAYTVMARVA